MRRLVWRPSYELGNALLDGQHRDLIDRVNGVFDAIESGASAETVGNLATDLVAAFEAHWRVEEDLFLAAKSPHVAEQRAVHLTMRHELARIRFRFAASDSEALTKAARTLRVWVETRLVVHINDDGKALQGGTANADEEDAAE